MNRPDHDDFWLMAEVVQDLDAAADDELTIERISDVDVNSMGYVALQRGKRLAAAESNLNVPFIAEVFAGGAWIDGFLTGVNFQKRKARKRA